MSRAQQTDRNIERIDRPYGRYRIVAGEWKGVCEARAFAGSKIVLSVADETVGAAVAELETRLDERVAAFLASREDAPSEAEYKEALHAVEAEVSDLQRMLLRAHSASPDNATTMAGLDATVRSGSVDFVITAYTRLGRLIGSYLAYKPQMPGLGRKLAPLLAIAVVDDRGLPTGMWTLRPTFALALSAHEKIVDIRGRAA